MRTCRYCNRLLPDSEFPLKNGRTKVRYKTCRECHELGHSCIEKPKPTPRKRMTDEERKEHMREYHRRYRATHREQIRENNMASYRRRKEGKPPKKRGPKPKPIPQVETRVCIVCHKSLPVDDFNSSDGRRTHSVVCKGCRPKVQPKPKPEPRAMPKPVNPIPKRTERGCSRCILYPCFIGIENLDSDFSITCKKFKPNN